MGLALISVLLCGLLSHVAALGGVNIECPGNQRLVRGLQTLAMPTCGAYIAGRSSAEHTDAMWPRSAAYADLPFACRCAEDMYLADDGVTCVTADQCDAASTRLCAANQVERDMWALDASVHTCYSYPEWYGDVMEPIECGCAERNHVIWLDGQTCVPREQCPPICHGDQVLNMLDGRDCTPTCADRNPECGTQPISRCECPESKPYLAADGVTCVRRRDCDEQPEYVPPPAPEPPTHPDGTPVVLQCNATQYPMLLPTSDHAHNMEWSIFTCRDRCWQTYSMAMDLCDGAPVYGCGCPEGTLWSQYQCVRQEACPQECFGSNQVWTSCGSPCISTCENPDPVCDAAICVPRCTCPADRPYLRDDNTCVAMEQCVEQPDCPGELQWTDCGSACTRTCDDPDPACIEMCMPQCECPAATPIRLNPGAPNDVARCVARDYCSGCRGDETYQPCPSCTITCEEPVMACAGVLECEPACACPEATPVPLGGGRCGTLQDCPVMCEGDLVYDACGGGCITTCDAELQVCPAVCQPGCVCPSQASVYLGSGRCGTSDECNDVTPCTRGLIYDSCGGCQATCDDLEPVCTRICHVGCYCPDDTPVLLDNGECGTRDQCDAPPECPGDKVFNACPSCWSSCEHGTMCADVTESCEPACVCPDDRPVHLGYGRCGTLEQCPRCSGDERLDSCPMCWSSCEEGTICAGLIHEEYCEPTCMCPDDAPVPLGDGRCGTQEDCHECPGDKVFNACPSCWSSCEDGTVCADLIETCEPACVCPDDRPVHLGYGRCGTLDQCPRCSGDERLNSCPVCWSSCDEPTICADIIDEEYCEPTCMCPDDAPVPLGDGRCGTQADCPECLGDQRWTDCGSACERTCSRPDAACTAQCVARCECPSDAPILYNPGDPMRDPVCVAPDRCPVCEGDLEFACEECRYTCDAEPDCVSDCRYRCTCPYDAPMYLGNNRCGQITDCPATGFELTYDTWATQTFSIEVKDMARLEAERALLGHPQRSGLKIKLKRQDSAQLVISIGSSSDAPRNATVGGICVATSDVQKIQVQYLDVAGEQIHRVRVNAGRKTYIGDVVQGVHELQMSFKKTANKKKIKIKSLRMPEDEDSC